MITSPTNPKVKEAIKLRESRTRRSLGCFLIDGRREIERAFHAGIRIIRLFFDAEVLDLPVMGNMPDQEESSSEANSVQILKTLHFAEIPLVPVSSVLFRKIAFGERNEGIVAVAAAGDSSLQAFETRLLASGNENFAAPRNHPLLLAVVEGVEKPGNVGALFRAADGAGLDGIILADPRCDLYHPHTIRASLGTLFHLPIAVATSQDVRNWLLSQGITVAAARCDGSIPYDRYDFRQPTAILLGSEAQGLSGFWGGKNIQPIRLPMNGSADSLNVATTGAILFYHAVLVRSATVST